MEIGFCSMCFDDLMLGGVVGVRLVGIRVISLLVKFFVFV